MSAYESIKPSLGAIKAIRDRDYDTYKIPVYQHYNWCLDYLNSTKSRVINPQIILSKEELEGVQKIMIKACTRYLKPRLWYDAPNSLWMCRSKEFDFTVYDKTAEGCWVEWEECLLARSQMKESVEEVKASKGILKQILGLFK